VCGILPSAGGGNLVKIGILTQPSWIPIRLARFSEVNLSGVAYRAHYYQHVKKNWGA